jgi:outer membrane protein assembly factor BamB
MIKDIKPSSKISLLACAILLSACSSVGDTISSFNPLSEKEKPLPGERRAVAGISDPAANVQPATATVAPASSLSEWPVAGGNASHNTGHVALAGGGSWRSKVGEASNGKKLRMSASPVVMNGKLFAYDPAGNVTAVSANGGSRVWRVSLRPEGEKGNSPGGGVGGADGRIFAATGFGQVAALNADNGAIIWSKEMATPALSSPLVADGKIFVVSQSNRLYALSQNDGSELWTFRGVPASAGVLGSGSPAYSQGLVIVPYASGELVALSATDGDVKWVDAVTPGIRRTALSSLTDMSAHPVVTNGKVIATSISGRTIAVNLKSGERLWETNLGAQHTPIVSGGNVFMIDMKGRIVALSEQDGTVKWSTQLPDNGKKNRAEIWSGPALAGGALYAVSNYGTLIRINPVNGAIVETRKIGSSFAMQPIAVLGKVFLTANDGTVHAIN